jgi:hypothetical protein
MLSAEQTIFEYTAMKCTAMKIANPVKMTVFPDTAHPKRGIISALLVSNIGIMLLAEYPEKNSCI